MIRTIRGSQYFSFYLVRTRGKKLRLIISPSLFINIVTLSFSPSKLLVIKWNLLYKTLVARGNY